MRLVLIGKRKLFAVVMLAVMLAVAAVATYVTDSHVIVAGKTTRRLPIYSVQTDEKKVALSFDASWGADKTESILACLEAYDVRANFFTVGFWAEKYPELLKKLHYSKRMEIGTHSNTHPHMSKLSKSEIELELSSSCRIISDIIGESPTLFRAPFGEYTDTVIETAESMGLYTIQWDVDTLDWKGLSAGEMSARVLKKVQPGSIVLMHNDGEHTVEALPLIIEGLKNKGYSFVTVGEMIYRENYTIDHNGKQIRKEG